MIDEEVYKKVCEDYSSAVKEAQMLDARVSYLESKLDEYAQALKVLKTNVGQDTWDKLFSKGGDK